MVGHYPSLRAFDMCAYDTKIRGHIDPLLQPRNMASQPPFRGPSTGTAVGTAGFAPLAFSASFLRSSPS